MKKKKRTLLWQLEPEEGATPSYLLGTIHAKCDEAFFQINEYCALIEKANVFAAEIDLEEMGNQDFIQHALLPDYQTLSGILPPKNTPSFGTSSTKPVVRILPCTIAFCQFFWSTWSTKTCFQPTSLIHSIGTSGITPFGSTNRPLA
ncbi:MAG: TraB/GumN family protein [Haliscomenobacter sp.]|nr:TraB/GumN family protein [Haliscomenobacter sp.]